MAHATCSINECDRAAETRGWCHTHYTRWRRHGDPTVTLKPRASPTERPDTCSFPGCDRPHNALGWCTTHWTRWKKHGDPGVTRRPVVWGETLEEKLLRHREVIADGCWLWTGNRIAWGYGMVRPPKSTTTRRVHRVAFEHWVGPIPKGMVIDHDCHNRDLTCIAGESCRHRRCFNPEHLVARTSQDNQAFGILRGLIQRARRDETLRGTLQHLLGQLHD